MAVLYYPPTQNGLQKTLDAQLDQGTTSSMTLNNVTGVQNEPGVVVINRINSDGDVKAASDREFVSYTGTSGNTLTGLTRGVGGSSDQDHAVGSVVEFIIDITWGQAVIDALANLVNPDDIDSYNSALATLTGTQTLTNKTLTSPNVGTSINDTNGNELVKVTATGSAVNELTQTNAATGNNPTTSATGDDSDVGWDIKMKGNGRLRRPSIINIQAFASDGETATGDGAAFFRVPAELNGMNLTGIAAAVYTAGTTGTTDIQIRNKTDSVDMLSTKLTIDSGETDSSTAATAAVINTANDDVATGDQITIDVDAVSSTPAQGLTVELRFELP